MNGVGEGMTLAQLGCARGHTEELRSTIAVQVADFPLGFVDE
jgi:hypothetical protein